MASAAPVDSDQNLVARVRRGDDRAFELLYQRYHRRIHAYVLGMVKDHGRTEDVTQEVFVSALRRMRETEQPLAFKPWLYQIAKNSCIDAFRRSKRAEEVSYDADEGLAPADHSRLVSSSLSPDAAVAAKQDLDSLCGAFGGLSETHHEILVLRELEGLSYAEIGRRMGMSRPAVESTLFRARRRLTEEFDDIVSGARCLRIQTIIMTAADSRLGARDTRRLARHLSHCQTCRREALAAGLDRGLFTRPPVRERIAARVAGVPAVPDLRTLPARRRRVASALGRSHAPRSPRICRCSPTSSQAVGARPPPEPPCWSRAWAPASGCSRWRSRLRSRPRYAHSRRRRRPARARSSPRKRLRWRATPPPPPRPRERTTAAGVPAAPSAAIATLAGEGTNSPSAADRATSAGGGSAQPAATQSDSTTPDLAKAAKPVGKVPSVNTPAGEHPRSGQGQPSDAVKQTGDAVNGAVQQTGDAVNGAVGGVTGTVDGATQGTGPVGEAVDGATDTVDDVVGSHRRGFEPDHR